MPKMLSHSMLFAALCIIALGFAAVRVYATGPKLGLPEPGAPLLDNEKLLQAIALVENWDGESIGAAGERGPWQMLESTWKEYSDDTMPFSKHVWIRSAEAHRVLNAHASRIRDWMEAKSLPQTAWTFALFWKAGYGRVIHNRLRPADKAYAERAQNIYKTLIK